MTRARMRAGPWALRVIVTVVVLFLVLPVFIVFPMSFSDSRFLEFPPPALSLRWYRAFFGSYEWILAAWVTLRVAVLSCALATLFGVAAAYAVHCARSRALALVHLALLSPLLVPHIIIAVGVFFVYARLGLNNTLLGLVLAHTMLALPFVVVTVLAGLQSFDLDQERVARSLGFNRPQAFLRVTLPQIKGSVFAGAVFAFMASLDEIMVSLFISGGLHTVLTKRMFNSLVDEVDPTIAAISSMLIVISLSLGLAATLAARGTQR